MARGLQTIQQQLSQEEVAEVIGGHRNLIALGRSLGLLQLRLVDRRITNKGIDRILKLRNRCTNIVQVTQIHQNVMQTILRDT